MLTTFILSNCYFLIKFVRRLNTHLTNDLVQGLPTWGTPVFSRCTVSQIIFFYPKGSTEIISLKKQWSACTRASQSERHTVQVRGSPVFWVLVRLGQIRLGNVRLGMVYLGQVMNGQARFAQARLAQVWLVQVRLGQVRLGQVS